jgi:hypothetical protein
MLAAIVLARGRLNVYKNNAWDIHRETFPEIKCSVRREDDVQTLKSWAALPILPIVNLL